MSKRLFGYDPDTATTKWFIDGPGESFQIYTEADVEPIVEMNKAKQRAGRDYYARDPDMWKVASVPNILLLKWAEEDGIPPHQVYSDEFAERIMRRLKSNEFRDLKTFEGQI